MLKISGGSIVTDGMPQKSIYISGTTIFAVTNEELPFDRELKADGLYVSPGFIDMHTHGGGGFDFSDGGAEAMEGAARLHLSHGTTTIFPTALTSDKQTNLDFIDGVVRLATLGTGLPHIGGAHMEGPYLSEKQAGAQNPEYIKAPEAKEYSEFFERSAGLLKKWTYAPEKDPDNKFLDFMLKNGIVPSIGHTDALFKEVKRAYDGGVRNMTHFYSAMSTIVRVDGFRMLGAVEAGYFFEDMNVEIIADGCHLPPELISLIYKLKGTKHTALVTDSMRGAGQAEGESLLGNIRSGVRCIIEDGVAKMPDRKAFAGSVATADRLVRTCFKEANISLTDSVRMMTETPAKIMGLASKGQIKEGFDADIVIFDRDINVKSVILGE